MVKIRALTEDDKEIFNKVFEQTILHEFPEYSQTTKNWFVAKKYREQMFNAGIRFGAFAEDRLVGYLLGPALHGGVAVIYWLAVVHKYQKQGIGSSLLGFF